MSRSDSTSAAGTDRFEAVRRPNRGVGVRDRVLVLPSVICSQIVADRIAARVPRAVSAPHDHGCAQLGEDNAQTERTLIGVGQNPNVSGVVVVGLGCEEVQSGDVAAALDDAGIPVRELSIQGVGGTEACVEEGVRLTRELVEESGEDADNARLGELTLGVVSSDLQSSTLETAEPIVGELVETVVDAGGRVVVAGTERFVPHGEATLERSTDAASEEVAALLDRHRNEPGKDQRVRRAAAERSFEAVSRLYGSAPIEAVVDYGERATHGSGVALLDAPARVEEAATGLAAAGAQVVVHVTADGIPTGHPIVPVLKLTGDSETYDALSTDIDVDATDASAGDLVERVLAVAGGTPSRAERHGLTEFAITRVGPSM